MPKISVILTVFNGGIYIQEAVASILNQTFKEFEFLIVDNASTDGTVAFLESLQDRRIRLIRLPENLGQTRALNRAVQEATGEWIARMDADDIALPERLAQQYAYLSTHPKAAVVGSWVEEINAQGRQLKIMKYPTDPWTIRCHLLSDGNLTHRCLAHPSVMFLRSVVLELGGYNEKVSYAQDYDLWTRISRDHEIHNIGRVLFRYRAFSDSASRRHLSKMTEELEGIVERNVHALAPDLSIEDQQRLVRFLRNNPPAHNETLPNLYSLFDQFFDLVCKNWQVSPQPLIPLRERIKAYYAPQFMARAPLQLISKAVCMALQHPGIYLDSKLYKNVVKKMKPPQDLSQVG